MSLGASRARLAALTKELVVKWGYTREAWQDTKSLEFERQYITELAADVDSALGVIDQLDKLAAKMRSDCE